MKNFIKKYNKTKKAKKSKKLTRGGEYNNFGYNLIPNASKELYQEVQHRLPLYAKTTEILFTGLRKKGASWFWRKNEKI